MRGGGLAEDEGSEEESELVIFGGSYRMSLAHIEYARICTSRLYRDIDLIFDLYVLMMTLVI